MEEGDYKRVPSRFGDFSYNPAKRRRFSKYIGPKEAVIKTIKLLIFRFQEPKGEIFLDWSLSFTLQILSKYTMYRGPPIKLAMVRSLWK